MNRTRLVVLVVALVCVAGLALMAATVSTPSSDSAGDGSGVGTDQSDGPEEEVGDANETGGGLPDILLYAGVVIFMITALVALRLLVKALNARTAVIVVIGLVIILIVGILALSAILELEAFGNAADERTATPTPTVGGGDGGNGRSSTETPTQNTDIPIVLLAAFGVVSLLLVAAIYRFSGTDTDVDMLATEDDETADETDSIQAVGEAAGRAADDLADDTESVENTIYQAWQEMTDALDVEQPRTTTPEEFSDIAIDAGMDPDDVRELTWLFEEVRYGDASVTDEREARARAALRRIQETYAGSETDV